jgi:hypothetical protein
MSGPASTTTRGHRFRRTEPEAMSSGSGTNDLAPVAVEPIASGTVAVRRSVGEGSP